MKEIEKILREAFNDPNTWEFPEQFEVRRAFRSKKYLSDIREGMLELGEVPVLSVTLEYSDPEFGFQRRGMWVNIPRTPSWRRFKKYRKEVLETMEEDLRNSEGDYAVSFRICMAPRQQEPRRRRLRTAE